jgi:ADP-heptose:LPS heptosyltransferase
MNNILKFNSDKPKKILLKTYLSPGDIVTLTAAVRDLKKQYGDQYLIGVDTSVNEIWQNNPYITKLDINDPEVQLIEVEYPLIHSSNTSPYHFIHGYRMFLEDKLNIKIPATEFKGDIHISNTEKSWMSQVEEMGIKNDFWIINAGGKYDFTAKWWNPESYQKVVDHFKDKITFVQIGEIDHFHTKLNNCIDLVGKTDFRQLIRLVYHSVGVLCPVTAVMHLAAAIETKKQPPKNRAAVVIAGGREPSQWEAYPHHQFLHTNGALDCCDNGGCWKSRCSLVGDRDEKDKNLCIYPIDHNKTYNINGKSIKFRESKCLNMITPEKVISAIETYYNGGVLKYNK